MTSLRARLAFVGLPILALTVLGALVSLSSDSPVVWTPSPGRDGGELPATSLDGVPAAAVGLTGTVRSLDTGDAIAEAWVWLEEPGAAIGSAPIAAVHTDSRGGFALAGIAVGTYDVIAVADGYAYATLRVELTADVLQEVTLDLASGSHLAGRVLDSEGNPIAAVSLVATPALPDDPDPPGAKPPSFIPEPPPAESAPTAWRALVATTEVDGTFRVIGLPRGTYDLVAHREGFENVMLPGLSTPTGDLVIILDSIGRVHGLVADALTGEPTPFARVLVAGSGIWPPREVRADATGTFHALGLPEGVYVFQAFGDGPDGSPRASPPLEGVAIVRAAEPQNLDIAVEPAMTVVGSVVSAAGTPVAGARVMLGQQLLRLGGHRASTDASGAFALPAVFPDDYYLEVWAPGHVEVRAEPINVPSPDDASEGTTDSKATIFTIDIALEAGATLIGRVTDAADGSPVGGAVLEVHGFDSAGRVFSVSHEALLGRARVWDILTGAAPTWSEPGLLSGADGGFVLHGLPAGTFRVRAVAPGYVVGWSAPSRLRGPGVTNTTVALVVGATVAGRIRDAGGIPLASVVVQATPRGGDEGKAAVTAADGTFTLRDLGGELVLRARKPGYVAAELELGRLEPGAEESVALTLLASPGAVRGRVVDERDFPIAGAEVSVIGARGRRMLRGSALTDPYGEFAVLDLDAGPFLVRASHPEYAPAELSAVMAADEVRLTLAAGATLLGRVIDADGGGMLDAFTIELRAGPGRSPTRRAFREGEFRWPKLAPGPYLLRVTAPFYAPSELEVELGAVEHEVEVSLERAGAVTGEVRESPSGWPIPGVRVAAHPIGEDGEPAAAPLGVGRTDGHGAFRLEGLPPGRYVLAVTEPGHEDAASDPVTVTPGETTDFINIKTPVRAGGAVEPDDPSEDRGTIAVLIEVSDGAHYVARVEPGSGAHRAGLAPGDALLVIDDTPLEGLSLAEAKALLEGAAGSHAVATVYRPAADEVFELRVVRDPL